MSAARPFGLTDSEQVLWDSRDRDREVIRAMQKRIARNPVRDLLWRNPWRSRSRPNLRSPRDAWDWLRKAHDCGDPSVGCSCSGGFRFGNPIMSGPRLRTPRPSRTSRLTEAIAIAMVRDALKFAATEPYGDLAMSADRAAGIAVATLRAAGLLNLGGDT
jgi:hypothetical protein